MVLNLIRNAIEAMEDARVANGVIRIEVACTSKDEVVVSVADCGPGLDPEAAKRIFDPFYSTKQGGLGVGLSISRAIVEAHGGRLTVFPNMGGGSVFQFTLPAANGGS